MSRSTLLDNLNSNWLAAVATLQPKSSQHKILVYVESEEDIAFWKLVLCSFESAYFGFDIQTPAQKSLEKGKTSVLNFANRAGKYLILCVDSDYDYLLQNKTNNARLINEHPFIFQTYTYSLENYQCYAPSLHLICIQSSKNSNYVIDFENLMQLYSNIIYPLFLWSFYLVSKDKTSSFTINNFCDSIKITDKVHLSDRFVGVLQQLKDRAETQIQVLEQRFPDTDFYMKNVKNHLDNLGVTPNNVYLFAQGHTIKEKVVLRFLQAIFQYLKNEKKQQIKEKAQHSEERKNQLNFYDGQIISVENTLNSNTEFKDCFLYKKLQGDLQHYAAQYLGK